MEIENGGVECILCSVSESCYSPCWHDYFPCIQTKNLAQVHLQGRNVFSDFCHRKFIFSSLENCKLKIVDRYEQLCHMTNILQLFLFLETIEIGINGLC